MGRLFVPGSGRHFLITSIEEQERQLRHKRKQRTQGEERKWTRVRRRGGDSAAGRQERLSRCRQGVTSHQHGGHVPAGQER